MPFRWTRRTFIATSASTLAAAQLRAATPASETLVYVGSTAKGEGAGIYTGSWKPATGTLSNFRLAAPANSAGFLAAGAIDGKRFLFAGHQSAPKVGALSAFQVDPSGDLHLVNTVTVPEFDMVHTALDHTRRCLITASYGTGKVLSVKIASDGRLSEPVSQFQLSGHGPNASRQSSPHAHGVAISPDNRFVLINDLGADRIMVYKLNPATAELTPNDPPYFTAAPGSGPRHLAFHPNGKWAYSINELDSTLTQLSWNATTGTLTLIESTPTLPPGGDVANNRAGEVVIDKSGRFLYGCNRQAPEELLVYAIDPKGHLTLVQRQPLGGKEARAFNISPEGNYFLVAEQFSNQLTVFARSPQKGDLKPTSAQYPVNNASCVVFI
ncbi:lactonase family protein [Granulicella sp. dw_53]|uniref:lactonase family protein n=1 Tax=Granulicella sp. dw_53 TaxID=2719792 RepID=UPI001BD5E9AF|nr:lactonase family protein [Granulicella sp. dw_53]